MPLEGIVIGEAGCNHNIVVLRSRSQTVQNSVTNVSHGVRGIKSFVSLYF